MRKGHVNQILLITDGCSNHGEDPLAIAALAKEQGITVNVIGIMEENRHDHEAMKEVEGIALARRRHSSGCLRSAIVSNRTNGYKKGDDANVTRCCE